MDDGEYIQQLRYSPPIEVNICATSLALRRTWDGVQLRWDFRICRRDVRKVFATSSNARVKLFYFANFMKKIIFLFIFNLYSFRGYCAVYKD